LLQRFDPESPLLSYPPFERLEDDQLLASPTSDDIPIIDPTKSVSERARERYLKQDPLAIVLSPSSIECRQCKRKIKLSSKSAYDPFHWRNHRARCIKAHKPKVKAMGPGSKASTSKKILTPPLSPRLPSLDKGSPMQTPPLISDCEDDRVSDHFGEHANSPIVPLPSESFAKQGSPLTSPSLLVNTMFDDYLRRSHPDYSQPATTSFQPAGRWRNWSWSQLEQPRFPVGDDYDDSNVDE